MVTQTSVVSNHQQFSVSPKHQLYHKCRANFAECATALFTSICASQQSRKAAILYRDLGMDVKWGNAPQHSQSFDDAVFFVESSVSAKNLLK